MLEAGMVAAVYLVLISVILAEPALDLLAGREYRDAVPVLQIQVFALIPVFISQVAQLGASRCDNSGRSRSRTRSRWQRWLRSA